MSSDLQKILEQEGFESLDEFVRSNLHYLPKNRQRVFDLISERRTKRCRQTDQYPESRPKNEYRK